MLNSPHLLLAFATFFWAANIVIGKAASVGIVPPFTLSYFRWVIAILCLAPFVWRRALATWPILRPHWKFVLFLALISVTAYNSLQYWALHRTAAINASVVSSSMPATMFLLTWLFGQERANRLQWLGLGTVTTGVLVIAVRGSFDNLIGLQFNLGDLAVFVAVICWCLYSVLMRRLPPETDRLGLLLILMIMGMVCTVPLFAWEAATTELPPITWNMIAILLYVGIFPSIVSYICWNRALVLGGANLAGIMNNLMVVFTTILAIVFLGESLDVHQIVGIALVGLGIYLATILGRARTPAAPAAPVAPVAPAATAKVEK
ncbi:MAG: DMT family transporter [Alphaproteobacteria bacterium]